MRRRMLHRAGAAAVALLLAGCLPYPRWLWVDAPLNQERLEAGSEYRLQVGDKVRVRTAAGKVLRLTIDALFEGGFYGVARDKRRYRVPYSSLDNLEVERMTWRIAA